MKKVNLCMLGLGLLMAACQSEWPSDSVVSEGEGNIIFQVSAPEAMGITRAGGETNSALGALTNVDFSQYDLRYQLAVFRIEGDDYVEAVSPQKKIVDSYEPVTYSLRLTPNRNYQVVVWADFVRQGETEDLHYDTHDFRNITVPEMPDKYLLNDESKDAYYISKNFTVENGSSEDLVLKRPFAKLRIVTTDWNYENLEMPDNFKVSYYGCKRFVNLDAVLGTSSYDELSSDMSTASVYTAILKEAKDYEGGYDMTETNRTIIVDYLMTDIEEQTPVHLTLEALKGDKQIAKQDLKTDIPIKRNWLTTIIGNTLTTDATFNISIDERFNNEWVVGEEWWKASGFTPKEPAYDEATKTYSIYTKEEFMWLPDHINEMLSANPNFIIRLTNDIDMSGIEWKPIYPNASGREYTFDGQGHTLRNFSMSGKYGAIYEYKWGNWVLGRYEAYTGIWGKFDGIMKDVNFENITINGLANDKVQFDTDGNPIDHSKEYAYFAGVVGYTGGNQWSMTSKFENVHVSHVQIKSSMTPAQNLGGLIGWVGSGGGAIGNRVAALKNCSAKDVHLTGYQAGGLVGQVLGDRGVQFDNCKTEDVYIRYNYISASSGFIGNIGDGGINISWSASIEINNCTSAVHVEYIKDSTGEPNTTYKPQSPYYGHKNDVDKVTITPTEP